VDRRHLFSDLSTDVGYLLGLRLSQNAEPLIGLDSQAPDSLNSVEAVHQHSSDIDACQQLEMSSSIDSCSLSLKV
jgi:hypothetical protein